MRTILEMYRLAGRQDAPIIFNLTGNVMEDDKQKCVLAPQLPRRLQGLFLFNFANVFRYMNAGSSGVLPKPTKPQDLVDMLQDQLSVRSQPLEYLTLWFVALSRVLSLFFGCLL